MNRTDIVRSHVGGMELGQGMRRGVGSVSGTSQLSELGLASLLIANIRAFPLFGLDLGRAGDSLCTIIHESLVTNFWLQMVKF